MNRWHGKVAVVTGASAGIGLAISKALVHNGMIVVGLARRKTKMETEMMQHTQENGKFIAYECDVSITQNVKDAFQWIRDNVGVVQILVNNAGIFIPGQIVETTRQDWEKIFKVNVMGLLECTKRAVEMMKTADVEGHIININSITGHHLHEIGNLTFSVYPASKHAITGITLSLQRELFEEKIRVTSISPGYVTTEILDAANVDINTLNVSYMPALESKDVAEAVIYVIGTPQRVQIMELTLRPLGERI